MMLLMRMMLLIRGVCPSDLLWDFFYVIWPIAMHKQLWIEQRVRVHEVSHSCGPRQIGAASSVHLNSDGRKGCSPRHAYKTCGVVVCVRRMGSAEGVAV